MNRVAHLLWESSLDESVDLCSGPTVDPEGERELESIPVVDEDWVILGPKSGRRRVRS